MRSAAEFAARRFMFGSDGRGSDETVLTLFTIQAWPLWLA
jgi:hypothetical protein